MWVFDSSTLACSAVNDAAVHDYGYSRKAFLSMTITDFRPSEGMLPLLSETSHRGTHEPVNVLGKHKKKDGRVIDVEITRCEVLFNGCVAKRQVITRQCRSAVLRCAIYPNSRTCAG
jgi:hypothetical protein